MSFSMTILTRLDLTLWMMAIFSAGYTIGALIGMWQAEFSSASWQNHEMWFRRLTVGIVATCILTAFAWVFWQ